MVMGRPPKYKKEYCQGIIDYFKDFEPFYEAPIEETSKDGQTTTKMKQIPNAPPSLTKFAESIDVSRETLHDWKRKFPEFKTAFNRAKSIYEDIYTDGAVLGMYNHGFTALIMKNRFDWKDKTETKNEHNFPSGVEINFTSPDEDKS